MPKPRTFGKLRADMAAFDTLPASIRKLLQEAPEPTFSSQSILDTIAIIGPEKTYELIAEQIFAKFGVMTGPSRIAQDRRNRLRR